MRSALALSLLALTACSSASVGTVLERTGDEISVCGQLFHSGTRVVLWNDPGGYDAYRATRRFTPAAEGELTDKQRYGVRRTDDAAIAERVEARGWALDDLRQVVHQFVIHYDQAGTANQCFRVLEHRNLSVHFLLDVDGTIYQTLDLKERAWHAAQANCASVGVEVAHIGAYSQPVNHHLSSWYDGEGSDLRLTIPATLLERSDLPAGYAPRPARDGILSGIVHGKEYFQYDFTSEQYSALAKLAATLHTVLPRIRLTAPRAEDGSVSSRAFEPSELQAYEGLLGHQHVTNRKIDPGPAFDWDRVLERARSYLH